MLKIPKSAVDIALASCSVGVTCTHSMPNMTKYTKVSHCGRTQHVNREEPGEQWARWHGHMQCCAYEAGTAPPGYGWDQAARPGLHTMKRKK